MEEGVFNESLLNPCNFPHSLCYLTLFLPTGRPHRIQASIPAGRWRLPRWQASVDRLTFLHFKI